MNNENLAIESFINFCNDMEIDMNETSSIHAFESYNNYNDIIWGEIAEEGANLEIRAIFKANKAKMNETAKMIKRMIKIKDYDKAVIEIENYEKMLYDIRNEVKNINAGSAGSMILGFIFGELPFIGYNLLAILGSIPVTELSKTLTAYSGAAIKLGPIYNLITEIPKLIARVKTLNKNIKEDGVKVDDFNAYKNGILVRIDAYINICNRQKKLVEKALSKINK